MSHIYMNPNDFINMQNLQESESESSESESSESESSESESSESESSESESSESESSESDSSESESSETESETLIVSRFQTGKVGSKISYKTVIKWLKNEIKLESMERKKI
jgi:cobalamin biosynthesis protein CobT